MKRSLAAEMFKLRHSRIWKILIILPFLSVVIGSANFYLNQGVLSNEWYSLWSQIGLFYGEFFFPILIAICSAYLWRLEHLNRNWYMIMTAPVSVTSLFLSKLIMLALLLSFVHTSFFFLYVAAGQLFELASVLPEELPGWLVRGWLAGLSIGALQLALSMRFRSFAVPVGMSLCATFIGLAMYVMDLGLFFPHSLLTIGMGVLTQTGFTSLGEELLFLLINLLYTVSISLSAILWLRKSDVTA